MVAKRDRYVLSINIDEDSSQKVRLATSESLKTQLERSQ